MTDSNIASTFPDNTVVRVTSSARLHLGFLDLNGRLGRKYGSLGLAIDAFKTCVEVSFSNTKHMESNANLKKVSALTHLFFETLGSHISEQHRNIFINIKQQTPQHAGFGSGTQLALCLGTALCRLYDIQASTHVIASSLSRGHRSGIGIHTFDLGGFIVDGGSGPQSEPPPLITHLAFPENWRILLVMDDSHQGVHGEHEYHAFKNLPIFPQQDAQTICHLTLMKLLPALVEHDCDRFGEAITAIQTILGQHFSPAQKGSPYTSDAVAQLLLYATQQGIKGIAQSSWGPTGCIFVQNNAQAHMLQTELEHVIEQKGLSHIRLVTVSACLHGANIEINPA